MKTLREKMNGENLKQLFRNGKVATGIKQLIQKVADFTVEESKVLSIRAQEAGRLTKLNAQKFKLNRDYNNICTEIGKQVIESSATGSKANVLSPPKVRELVEKAGQIERDIKLLDEEIEYYKKECDGKIKQIHKKAA
ncbi:MAG: hypothetical protein AAB309_03005 [Deltaproteobacteria bacterium]